MSEKIIYITGASSGIGAALAKYFAAPGVTLCLLANADRDALEGVATECAQRGAKTETFLGDVVDRERMHAISRDIIARFGLPHLVIANAGICPVDPDDYVASHDPHDAMAVNYFGVIHTFAAFINPMKQRRSGHLVAVSSVSALRATPNSGIYSASKTAVNMWTEGLRLKLASFGISVTIVCPGFVRTAMTDKNTFYMPGIISAERAAQYIGKAIRSRRSRYYFPPLANFIWKTFHMLPGWLYDFTITFARKHWPDTQHGNTDVCS